jgi:hypothetical protein
MLTQHIHHTMASKFFSVIQINQSMCESESRYRFHTRHHIGRICNQSVMPNILKETASAVTHFNYLFMLIPVPVQQPYVPVPTIQMKRLRHLPVPAFLTNADSGSASKSRLKVSTFFSECNFLDVFIKESPFFTSVIVSNMLLYTRFTFFGELSVFWLCFYPQFQLILHLLDPDPGSQSNADPMRIRIRNTDNK